MVISTCRVIEPAISIGAVDLTAASYGLGGSMIILGIVLLVLGLLLNVNILYVLGIILVVVGAVLFLLGSSGRAIGGRRHYY
jgi:hypothetical protein